MPCRSSSRSRSSIPIRSLPSIRTPRPSPCRSLPGPAIRSSRRRTPRRRAPSKTGAWSPRSGTLPGVRLTFLRARRARSCSGPARLDDALPRRVSGWTKSGPPGARSRHPAQRALESVVAPEQLAAGDERGGTEDPERLSLIGLCPQARLPLRRRCLGADGLALPRRASTPRRRRKRPRARRCGPPSDRCKCSRSRTRTPGEASWA